MVENVLQSARNLPESLTQSEIKKLFKEARRVLKHPGFDILVAPTQRPQGHLMVVTPGRVGNAVERNKVRRRIKAIFHEHQLTQKGFDTIIFIKKLGVALTHAELSKIILATLTPKSH